MPKQLHKWMSFFPNLPLLGTGLLMCLLLLPLQGHTQGKQVRELIDEGRDWEKNENWDSLLAVSERLLRFSSAKDFVSAKAEIHAHLFRSKVPDYQLLYEASLADLTKADSLLNSPTPQKFLVSYHFHLGHVNYYLKEPEQSLKHFQQALKLHKNKREAILHFEILNGLALASNYLTRILLALFT